MNISSSTSPFSLQNSLLALKNRSNGNKTKQLQEIPSIQKKDIVELQNRDREVRNHEQAHMAASGGLAKSGASFSFQRGSDGKFYAVGGEVSIDTSPIPGNPQATIQKAQQIRAAALAPADPSAQDRAVAVSAHTIEAAARQKMQQNTKEDGILSEKPTDAIFSRIDVSA